VLGESGIFFACLMVNRKIQKSQIIHWELSEGANQWIIWDYPDIKKSRFWCRPSKPEKLIFLNRSALEIFLMQ